MRKRKQPDFWRPAFIRFVEDWVRDGFGGPEEALAWLEDDDDDGFRIRDWAYALEEATAGDWEYLDGLIEWLDAGDDSKVPPPSLWPMLDAFFAAPPNRKKGKKPRFVDWGTVGVIRNEFKVMTTLPANAAVDVLGRAHVPPGTSPSPPLTAIVARKYLAYTYNVSDETIRDIVEGRKTYKVDPRRKD